MTDGRGKTDGTCTDKGGGRDETRESFFHHNRHSRARPDPTARHTSHPSSVEHIRSLRSDREHAAMHALTRAPRAHFEQVLAAHGQIRSLQCVELVSPHLTGANGDIQSHADDGSRLTITTYDDSARALFLRAPRGGVALATPLTWQQDAGSVLVKAGTERHEVAQTFVVAAKQTDWTSSQFTLVADRLRLQSSASPLDVHSFSTHNHGIALRCPKGGVAITSGRGGMRHATAGNVDIQMDGAHTHLRLASHGTTPHTIHLGNPSTETIVENQLTVKGKLVLSDDTVLEKRVSVVHELQNVVELGGARTLYPRGESTDALAADHPDAEGYDFGVVARQAGRKSGMVYDHRRAVFYFSSELGTYEHHRFSLPNAYADVQARVFLAQQKLHAPFVDAHLLQCRTVRHAHRLTLQAPHVDCAQHFTAASMRSELVKCTKLTSRHVDAEALDVPGEARVGRLCTTGEVRIGNGSAACVLDRWLFNTVGPHGAHRTLQEYLDAGDDLRASTGSSSTTPSLEASRETLPSTDFAVLQATNTPHSCNAVVNLSRLTLDGRHSILTGVLEVTEEVEELLIVDARVAQFTLTSNPEYSRDHPRPMTLTLRNVHGVVKDWSFDLPTCTLRLEHCRLQFTNRVVGRLNDVVVVQSEVLGGAWTGLTLERRGGK